MDGNMVRPGSKQGTVLALGAEQFGFTEKEAIN